MSIEYREETFSCKTFVHVSSGNRQVYSKKTCVCHFSLFFHYNINRDKRVKYLHETLRQTMLLVCVNALTKEQCKRKPIKMVEINSVYIP